MSTKSIQIGVPELSVDDLEDIIGFIENSIRKFIFSKINPKFIDDFNVEIILEKEKELSLIINIEICLYDIYIPDLEKILDNALKVGEKSLIKKINQLKSQQNEDKD
ncbi:MAG: DUF3194 domain-containing protein [Candidatus Helarchaeota archaeon]